MPDWGSPVSGAKHTGYFGSQGVTPGTAENTKGAWANVGTVNRSGSVAIGVSWFQDYSTFRLLSIDLAIGTAGNEVVILENLTLALASGGATLSRIHNDHIDLPIALPSGSLIRARAQSTYASHGAGYLSISYSHNNPSPMLGGQIKTYGADTANTAGTTITASNTASVWGSYTQITASCERMSCFFVACFGRTAQTNQSNQDGWFEIAVGAAGDEKTIASGNVQSTSGTKLCHPQWFGPFYQSVAAGQRLSARLQRQGTTQRTLDIIVYGVK